MTSALKEPSGRDDRSDRLGAGPEEGQLDLFEILRPLAASGHNDAASPPVETGLLDLGNLELGNPRPPRANVSSLAEPKVVEPDNVEMIGSPAAQDCPDVGTPDLGTSDADDLRRLEESIRWLMNAGTTPLPQTTPLPPVVGLSPLHPDDADSLLLDPETLFLPRAPLRGSTLAAGAAKFLLVSAIAAPTAYFVASWMQFPGAAAPSDQTDVSDVVTPPALSGELALSRQPVAVEALQEPVLLAAAPQADRGVEIAAPQQAMVPQPASRAAEVIVVAALATAPEPRSVAVPPPAEAVSAPTPAKPVLRQEEIAMMIERGRVLFEAGDVAAARLFFRRAANAGDAAAAIAMGATYDPEVLTQRFIHGIEADAQEAQKWYEKAREMGRHVEMLAHR
jgi:hypothetical protein